MNSELKHRSISGLFMIIMALIFTWEGGLIFRLFVASIMLLVYFEWLTIIQLKEQNFIAGLIGGIGLIFIAANIAFGNVDINKLLLISLFTTVILNIIIKNRTCWFLGGTIYSSFIGISLIAIRDVNILGFIATIFIFTVVWTTDVFAYFSGKFLKGPKIVPNISPGKTWSGAITGTLSAIIVGSELILIIFGYISLWIIVLALVLSIISQVGDLFESFIKRYFGVKDSSHLIPGHGGIMDRIDGLIFACFTVFFLAFMYTFLKEQVDIKVANFILGF